jgi:hypothetical protein
VKDRALEVVHARLRQHGAQLPRLAAEWVVADLREAGLLERPRVCTCGVSRGFTMSYRRCPVHPRVL